MNPENETQVIVKARNVYVRNLSSKKIPAATFSGYSGDD